MANQTVTTAVNYDSAVIGGLLDGESITINGGSLTFNADARWNQQAAVFGGIDVSATLGGAFIIDGTQVWEVPFTASSGNVPTQVALGSNPVTGGTSGATGELTRVWAAGSFTPATAGAAMPAAGYVKLRSRTGNFQEGETITLPGGATIVASNAGKRGWIHLVGRLASVLTLPRIANVSIAGDWYNVGVTNGADSQTLQMPVRDEFPAIQIETAPGSGVYEWWMNGGDSWNGWYVNTDSFTGTNLTAAANAVPGPASWPAADRYRETTATGTHSLAGRLLPAGEMEAGSYTHFAIVRQDSRQWCVVQISTNSGTDRYGALVDLAAGTIIANPTVGSPTGTSSTITALGGGWHLVEVTLTHSTGVLTSALGWSDSATPTYSGGLPTYTGNAAQGGLLGISAVRQASFSFIPTDEARGKWFYSDPFSGTITLAMRGTNNAGFKPASGCAIRIPNIILGVSTAGDYSAQYILTRDRYQANVGNCVFTASHLCFSWLFTIAMTTFKLAESSLFLSVSVQSFNTEFRNCAFGNPWWSTGNALTVGSSSNFYMYDCRIVRRVVGSGLTSVSAASNINFVRCRFERITASTGRSTRTGNASNIINIAATGGEFTDCTVVNGNASFNVLDFEINNLTYCDVMTGTTPALASTAMDVQGRDIVIDGFSLLPGVTNVHPRDQVVNLVGFFTNMTIKNMGTPTSLISGGSANELGRILNIVSAGKGLEMRRCYFANIRTTPITTQYLAIGARFYDVWGIGLAGASSSQQVTLQDAFARGCRWTNSRSTGSNAITGTHWDEAYSSDTTGIITILCYEPTVQSAGQCSATFGLGSGFTGTGSAVISKLTDEINWTTPWKIYGHNFLAGGCAVLGGNCQNLIFEYKIDTGSGFGASWAFLANTVRRASGGTSGTNTVTVTTADRTALTRQPHVGDFVQSSTFKLPANTTVTNVSGDVITCSANFTGTLATNEFVTFTPINVAVSAANGYSLQVRTRATAAAATTSLQALSIGTQTDATAQRTPHPLPGALVNISNLIPQSRVKVTRMDTGALLQQVNCGAGSTLEFDFQYSGEVRIEARNASGGTAYRPWFTQATISSATPINVVALQEAD